MNIQISIECESINEFWLHLNSLQKQIKKEAKKRKLDPLNDAFPPDIDLDDSNCYGDHTVKITKD